MSTEEPTPAEGLPAAAREAFGRLQARFAAGLAQRWQAIIQAPGATERAALLHQLIGAAGAYGYPALSQAARQAEQACLAADADQGPAAPALAALQAALEAVSPQRLPPLALDGLASASQSDDT